MQKNIKDFEDAYKSQLSIIILDDIERHSKYVAIGLHILNHISHTLLALEQALPLKGNNILLELHVSANFLSPLDVSMPSLSYIMSLHWPRKMS